MVMVRGNPYFPRASIENNLFAETDLTTIYGWKDFARYWDEIVRDQGICNSIWTYDTAKPEAESLRERFATHRDKGVDLQQRRLLERKVAVKLPQKKGRPKRSTNTLPQNRFTTKY